MAIGIKRSVLMNAIAADERYLKLLHLRLEWKDYFYTMAQTPISTQWRRALTSPESSDPSTQGRRLELRGFWRGRLTISAHSILCQQKCQTIAKTMCHLKKYI
jgi:hypothetical protein